MRSAATQASPPDTSDMIDELSVFPIACVVSATILPGFTLCIPGLLFVTLLVLIPVAVVALAALLATAVVAAPFVAVRKVRALHERRAEARRVPQVMQPVNLEG